MLFGERRLSERAHRIIEEARVTGDAAVSAITFWEVAMLHAKDRLSLLSDVGSWRASLLDEGLVEVPVDGEIGIRAAGLSGLEGDPADRLIVATALGGFRLVTADRKILDWPGPLSKLDATR